MPKKSKLDLTPVSFGDDTLGLRLARIRKERGFTQVAIAQLTGLTQVLVSDYEPGRLSYCCSRA
jgi:predicted transcriptional regulator